MEHVVSNQRLLVKEIKQQNQQYNAAEVLIPVMTVESNVMCLENNTDKKHPHIQARKLNKKFKSLDLHYIKPQQQQATKNIRNNQQINYVHVSSEMLSSAGSSNDISGNTGNSSKNSVNSNDNYDIQPQKQHSYLKSGNQNNYGKLVRNVERKSSVPDASSLAYKDRTQLKKPKKVVKRAEIVAAVTKRLYTTKKKVDAKPEPEPQLEEKVSNDEEPEELKLCSRARFKLQEISKRALNIHRKMKHLIIDMETQTDFIPTLRVKEIGLNTDISGGIHTSEVAVNTNMFEFPIHLLLCENKLIHHNVCNHMTRVNNQFDTTLKSKNSKTVIFKEVSVATDDNYFQDTCNTDFLNSDMSKVNSICEEESYNNFMGKSCLCMKYVEDQIIKGAHEQYSHIEQLSFSEPSRSNFSVQTNIPTVSSDKDSTVGGLSKDQLKCCCFSEKFACDNNEIKYPKVADFGISKCAKNFVPGNGSNKMDMGVGTSNCCSEIYRGDNFNTKEVQTHINPDIKETKLKSDVTQQKGQSKTYNVRNSIGTLTDFYYPSSTLWNWKKCINFSSGEFMNIDGAKSFKFKRPDTYIPQNISDENISDDSLDICNNFKLTNEQYEPTLEQKKLPQNWNLTNFKSGKKFYSPVKKKYDNYDNGHLRPLSTIFSKNNKNPEKNEVLTEPHAYGLTSKIIGNAGSLVNTSSNKMRLQYGVQPLGLEPSHMESNDKIFSEQTNISSNFHSKDTKIYNAKGISNEINSDKSEQDECESNKIFSMQNHEANNTHLSTTKCHCSNQSEKINILKTDDSIKDVLQRLFASNTDILCNGLLRNQSAQTEKVCLSENNHQIDFNCNESFKAVSNASEKGETSDNCYNAGPFDSMLNCNENNECTQLDGKMNTCVYDDQYFNDQGPKLNARNREPKFYLNEESHLKYFSNNLTLSSPFSHKNCPQHEDNQQYDSFGCVKSKSLDYILSLQNSCVDGRMGSFKMNQEQVSSQSRKQDENTLRELPLKQLTPEISLKQDDVKADEHSFVKSQTASKTDKNSVSDNHKLYSPITLISEKMTFFISKPLTHTNGTNCSKHIKQKDEGSCTECLESQNVQSLLGNLNQDVRINTERLCCKQKPLISQDSKCDCLETGIPENDLLDKDELLDCHSKVEVNDRIKYTLMKESIPSLEIPKETTGNSVINAPSSNNAKINPNVAPLKKKQTHATEEACCSNNESHWSKTNSVDKSHKQNTDLIQTNQLINGTTACTKAISQTSSNIMINKNSIPNEHSNESTSTMKKKFTRKKKKNCSMSSPRSRMDTLNITDPITHGWGNAGAVGTWFTLSTFVKKANTLLKSLGEVSEMMEKVKNNQSSTFNEPQTTNRRSSFKASVQPTNQCIARVAIPSNGEQSQYQTSSFENKYCEENLPISPEPYLNNYVTHYDDNKLYRNIKYNELSECLYAKQNVASETLKSVSVKPDAHGNHQCTTRKSLPCFIKTNKSHCLQTQDLNVPQQIQKELPLLNFSISPSSTSSVPYESFPENDSFSKVQTKRYLQESYSMPDFNQHTEQTISKKAHCCFGNVFNNIVNYQRHRKKQIHIACLYTTDASMDNFGIHNESVDLRSIPRCLEMARSSPRLYKQYLLDLRRQIASDSGYCLK